MTDEEVIAKCIELDMMYPFPKIYLLTSDNTTYKLTWMEMYWAHVPYGARQALVKSGSIFFSEDEVKAAKERALNRK